MASPLPNPPEPDQNGGYDSPPLAALRQVWRDYGAEQAGEVQVMDVVAEVERFAQHNLGLLEQQIAAGFADQEDPALARIWEAFELLLEGCEIMALEFLDVDSEDPIEEPEEGFFEFGLSLVQEATNLMMEGRQQGLEDPSTASPGEVTENCLVLLEAVSRWQADQASVAELTEVIESIEQKLLAHLEDTKRQESLVESAPAAVQPLLCQTLGQTRAALELSLAAVERMRRSLDKEEDDGSLHLGMADFEEASRRMVASFRTAEAAVGR